MTAGLKLTHLPSLANWLSNTIHRSSDDNYYHRHLEENLDFRRDLVKELQVLVHQAHEDSRQRLRNAFDIPQSLDPLEEQTTPGINTAIIDEFPRYLDLKTLKGYFGEIFAAIVAENFNSLDEDWTVPIFPFRHHQMAYHALEKIRQEGGPAPTTIGRFGDDMLAFQRDAEGNIIRALVCEAKCTATHNSGLIADAHEKASAPNDYPVDCFQLAETLKEYLANNPDSASWYQSIRNLWLEGNPTYERCDLVSYVLGLPPVSESTVVIPRDAPHSQYTAGRRLESVQVYLHDVDGLIQEAYQAITRPWRCSYSTEELSQIWNSVVSCMWPSKQTLFQEDCVLLFFNGELAVVGVLSLEMFRIVQRKESSIKRAFLKSGLVAQGNSEGGISIKLQTV